MAYSRGLTEIDGNFTSESRLVSSLVDVNSVVLVNGVPYTVDNSDLGNGIALNNGYYANRVIFPEVQALQADNPNNQTGTTYTLTPSDKNKTIWMNNAAANTVTVDTNANQNIDTNSVIMVMMEGAGVTTITAAAGVTLNGVDGGSTDISAQYSGATLVKRGANNWVITGSISGVS